MGVGVQVSARGDVGRDAREHLLALTPTLQPNTARRSCRHHSPHKPSPRTAVSLCPQLTLLSSMGTGPTVHSTSTNGWPAYRRTVWVSQSENTCTACTYAGCKTCRQRGNAGKRGLQTSRFTHHDTPKGDAPSRNARRRHLLYDAALASDDSHTSCADGMGLRRVWTEDLCHHDRRRDSTRSPTPHHWRKPTVARGLRT